MSGKTGVMAHAALREIDAPIAGVRIWSAQLEALSDEELAELRADLSTEELERAARFHFERDRKNFIGARGLLRRILALVANQPARALRFDYGAHGKPLLPPLHFNLSHAQGWALFAVAENCEIGIDLESGARLEKDEENLERLAARILSANELGIWRKLSPEKKCAAFLRAWTRKEVCAKATGRGVFETFEKLEVILDAERPQDSLHISAAKANGLTSDLFVYDLVAPAGFTAALAIVAEKNPVLAPGGDA